MKHRKPHHPGPATKRFTGPAGAIVLVLAVIAAGTVLSRWKPWERGAGSARVQATNGSIQPVAQPQPSNAVPVPTLAATNTSASSNDPAALVEEGTALFYQGDPEGAIRKYSQALKLTPDDEEIHFNLARAFTILGRTNEAILHYNEALKILPDYAEAHNNLGNLLVSLRRHPEAMEHYSAALKANPDNSSALNNLGRCLAQLGQTREAVIQFSEAVRLHPEYLEAHFNLAAAQAVLGDFDEAIRHYEKVLQLEPDFPPARAGLERARAKKAATKTP